jgi:hypothetical protein
MPVDDVTESVLESVFITILSQKVQGGFRAPPPPKAHVCHGANGSLDRDMMA